MIKRLALILAVISSISPLSAYALGLGSIDMRSTLNQRLDARIELLRVRPGELKGLEINLADADTFRRAGIERPEYLNRLNFSLVRPTAGSKAYIQISSPQPITEPFLNFLVEVNWSNGRLLREFTVLVDPPVLAEKRQATRAMEAPVVSRPSAPRQERIVTSERPTTRSVPRSTRAAPDVSSTAAGGVTYGPTRQGDTLWEIAARMIPEGSSITVPQMMMALLERNPNAFYGGNINNLKMGHVLRLDDASSATTIGRNDAARMANMQWQEWKENRGQTMMGSAPARTRSASSGRPTPGARVQLVSPDEGEAGDGTPRSVADDGEVARLNEELSLAQEALDATKQETSELNERMSALNEQIETMKRLVDLKDSQLAALQSQLKEAGQQPEMPAEAEDAAATAEPAAEAEEMVADAGAEQAAPEMTNDKAEMDAILSGDDAASQKVEEKPAPVETAEAPAAADSGIMGTLMALPGKLMTDYKYPALGVLAFLVILGVAVAVSKRKKMQAFQESILTGQSSVGEGADGEVTDEDASFMSDFAVSSMEGIATDVSDVDPVSEADVYMAYGRYKQAEELIATAIESHPDRDDLKLKVLEIHYAAKDKEAFEQNANMYKGALGAHWDRVSEMGAELAPDNPLFSGGAPAAGDASSDATIAMDAVGDDLDFDLDSAEEAGGEMLAEAQAEDIGDLDFDLGGDEDTTLEAAMEEAPAGDNSLDFDLGDFDSGDSSDAGSMTEQVDVVAEMSDDSSDEMSLDMDMDLDMESTEDATASDDNSLDFDLGSLDTGEPAVEEETAPAEVEAELDMDDSMAAMEDNSLDFDIGGLEEEAPAAEAEETADAAGLTDVDLESELDESLFADVDEVGTKLDLARAYIDMGDSDGAKSILDEVMQEGDDSQKNEAEGLMQQMA